MEIGRLYSRICGWENGTPVKYFYSAIMTVFPIKLCDIDGKNATYIIKFMDNLDIKHEYPDAYNLCKKYTSWYFYYGENKEITSIEN